MKAEDLKSQLSYEAESGLFRWRMSRGKHKDGDIAGCVNLPGYIVIRVDGTLFRAHRLAWLYVTGEWPVSGVDHINGDRADNRFGNLRLATQAQNLQNQRTRAASRSGYLGVSLDSRRGTWRARIGVDGKQKQLGYFDSPHEAYAVYVEAKRRLHDFAVV